MLAKQKGGCGASTIARELGVAAAAEGQRVVFVDLDPQGTLSRWWNRRTAGAEGEPNPALACPPPEQLLTVLAQMRASRAADLAIIDVPPSTHGFMADVMGAADLALVPVRPTADDFDALPDIIDMIEAAGTRYAFAITQAPPGARSRAVEEALPVLARQGRVGAGDPLSGATSPPPAPPDRPRRRQRRGAGPPPRCATCGPSCVASWRSGPRAPA